MLIDILRMLVQWTSTQIQKFIFNMLGCIQHEWTQVMNKERKCFLTGKVEPASNRIVSENKVILYGSCFFQ